MGYVFISNEMFGRILLPSVISCVWVGALGGRGVPTVLGYPDDSWDRQLSMPVHLVALGRARERAINSFLNLVEYGY